MAGRAKVGGTVMPVRFGDGVLERIDVVAGKGRRSEFIREAVEAALRPVVIGYDLGGNAVTGAEILVQERDGRLVRERPSVVVPIARPVEIRGQINWSEVEWCVANERSDKMVVLLDALKVRSMTARQASEALCWPDLLVAKVADKLVAAGLVHFPRGGGVMEAR